MREFTIGKNDAGQRLDKFLTKAVKGLPKSLMYKYIRTKKIKVNRARTQQSYMLCEGDVIHLFIREEFFDSPELDKGALYRIQPKLSIVYEDDNILLLNKRPGVLVHEDTAPSVIAAAKRATVPVVVHYDHGLTFERCMEALQLGFSSVMFDGSAGDYEKNIKDTAEIVKIAHSFGATVEGEIGHVGQADSEDNDQTDLYTKVSEATDYLASTGVDALAISIGTAHGAYKSKPKLDLQRLSEISAAVDVPLVLHGGSGLTDDDFRNSIACGISKVNIFTDMCLAGNRAMAKGLAEGKAYLDIRNMKVDEIKEEVKNKMLLFGCDGKY